MGHEISIIRPDREPLILAVDDSSYRRREIMGEDELVLNFSLAVYEEIPAGSTVTFEGDTYTLFQSCRVDKRGSRNFEYQATFSADYAYLRKYMFYNWVDKRLSFDLTARPWEHIQMIVDNLNDRLQSGDTPWRLGEGCIESAEKLISYSCNNCMEALQAVADTFETEWEVKGRTIFLRKVEYNADSPLELSYGRGNGLRAGIQRTAYNDETPAARVYIQGGERNIFLSEYGSRELKFPKSARIGYDGEKYEGEDGYDNTKAVMYVTDDLGQSVAREGGPVNGGDDVALDLTHIYPSHTCEVESVQYLYKSETYGSIDELVAAYPELADENAEGWDNVQVDVIVKEDAYLPDYSASELQVPGETRQVVFQSGNLASREFDINDYDHEERRFKLVSEWVDGFRMPAGPVYHPSTGNTFIVAGVSLPSEYVSEAEDKALREAVKYLYEHEAQKVTINAEIDPIQAARMWDSWSPKIILGGFVRLTDDDLLAEVSDIRIRAVKQYVNAPTKPVVELSNSTVSVSFGTTIRELENQEVHTGELHKDSIQFTKRSFAQVRETLTMLEGAIEGFEPGINPITLETMAVLVGSQTLQFKFIESLEDTTKKTPAFAFDETTGIFSVPQSYLMHYTIDQNEITTSQNDASKRKWEIDAFESEALIDGGKAYYLYAYVPENGTGSFELSLVPKDFKVDGGYNLLVGVLNTEFEGTRSFVPLYGYTEVLPGQITTDVIRSADGNTFFDLVNGVISGKIHFEAGSSGLENLDLRIGAYNLLRNSGFTGDYLSETLTDEAVLDAVSEMYSSPLDHWIVNTGGIVTIIDPLGIAVSGRGATISTGSSLSQNLYYNSIINENYVFSFKATSLAVDTTTTLVLNCGGVRSEVSVEYGWKDYAISFVVTTPSNEFNISTAEGISICDLQLERGTIASSWGSSWLDNSSDRAYWQSMKYLQSAIAEGYTEVNGGLILTNHIQVGNTADGKIKDNTPTGGMNGLQEDGDDSVFLWGGGTITEAQAAVDKYKADPSYQPTDAELAEMAKFVVTHGGRAILNDMILRGYVYALGGKFQGEIDVNAKNVNGRVVINDNGFVYYGTDAESEYPRVALGSTCQSASGVFLAPNADAGFCTNAALLAVGTDTHYAINAKGDVTVSGDLHANGGVYTDRVSGSGTPLYLGDAEGVYPINIPNGKVGGLRTTTKVITSTGTKEISNYDFSILVNLTSGSVTLTFPSEPIDGQEYIVETKGADITISSAKNIYNHYNGNILSGSITDRGVIRFKYYEEASQWTMTWLELHQ